jgi:hypothetical protein
VGDPSLIHSFFNSFIGGDCMVSICRMEKFPESIAEMRKSKGEKKVN